MASTETLILSDDLARLCRQSKAIHPDWSSAEHLAWLSDEGIDPEARVHFIGTLTGHRDSVQATVEFWIDRGGLR